MMAWHFIPMETLRWKVESLGKIIDKQETYPRHPSPDTNVITVSR
jgi:hypothetical protein